VLTFADLPAAAPLAEAVPAVDDPVWDAWRVDFRARLEADPAYQAGQEARWAYDSEDPNEQARLKAVRDARYYKFARIVYEQHFGKWIGDDGAFEELIGGVDKARIDDCKNAAFVLCGKAHVRWMIVDGPDKCRFACDVGGVCPASPID